MSNTTTIENVSLTVHEKTVNELQGTILELKERVNDLLTPGMAEKAAEMNFQLKMAKQLIASKAFPNVTPEQAFVLLQAGKEMGMQPMESLKKLYIVNGAVGFHGAGLVEQLTKAGAFVDYENETDSGVTVVVEYMGREYRENVTDKDQILQKSKAMTFAKKNKMRYHGCRMILSTRLPHLSGSVSVWDADDFEATKENAKGDAWNEAKAALEGVETKDQLNAVYEAKKAIISKDIELLSLFGAKKRLFQ